MQGGTSDCSPRLGVKPRSRNEESKVPLPDQGEGFSLDYARGLLVVPRKRLPITKAESRKPTETENRVSFSNAFFHNLLLCFSASPFLCLDYAHESYWSLCIIQVRAPEFLIQMCCNRALTGLSGGAMLGFS